MTHADIRKKFLKFFKSRGHTIVLSSSLVPEDQSVLFTTAGMQQFKPYFLGDTDPVKDFGGRRIASIQKSMRTSDIDKVGDESHLTFFEMLGHFSFGDYFKKETIEWTYEFLTDVLKISKDRISATVFAGDDKIPFDSESYDAWSPFLPAGHIRKGLREDNIWGPPGPEGPCGAANEVYVDDLEVATLVFMEYYCDKNKILTPLSQKGVDVGWGFERIVQIVQGEKSVFDIDLLKPVIKLVPMELNNQVKRIVADHSRAIAFLVTDGVRPSNKEQGYILRRLMRRVITYFYIAKSDVTLMHDIFAKITEIYEQYYPELNANIIIHEFDHEKEKFEKVFPSAIKELEKIEQNITPEELADKIFNIYESKGMPIDSSIEFLKGRGFDQFIIEGFENTVRVRRLEHQEKSRAGVEKKFGKQ